MVRSGDIERQIESNGASREVDQLNVAAGVQPGGDLDVTTVGLVRLPRPVSERARRNAATRWPTRLQSISTGASGARQSLRNNRLSRVELVVVPARSSGAGGLMIVVTSAY